MNLPVLCRRSQSFEAVFRAGRKLDAVDRVIVSIKKSFVGLCSRLESQINQWVSCFVHALVGYVTDELIERGVLETPAEKPLTNGVFYVEGKEIEV